MKMKARASKVEIELFGDSSTDDGEESDPSEPDTDMEIEMLNEAITESSFAYKKAAKEVKSLRKKLSDAIKRRTRLFSLLKVARKARSRVMKKLRKRSHDSIKRAMKTLPYEIN